MQASKLTPARGLSWLLAGMVLVRRSPMPLLSAASTIAMLALLLGTTPVLGQVALLLLLPVFEVGMFLSCRAASEREFVHPALLFSGFRMNLRPLFALGGIRLLGSTLILLLAFMISGIDVEALKAAAISKQLPPEALQQAAMRLVAWFVALRLPLEMATWFATPCIALRGAPVIKALFFSFIACWRNLGAMIVFVLALALLGGLLPSLLLTALGALPQMVALPLFAVAVVVGVAVFYAAFYVSACEVFGPWPHPWTHAR